MPVVFFEGPYRFFFFSKEGNEPVHIHVERDDSYAKFWIFPVQLAKSSGFNAKELRKIEIIVEQNQSIIQDKWNEHFDN